MNAPTAAIAAPTVTSSPLPISREIWHAGHPIFDINGSAIVVPRPPTRSSAMYRTADGPRRQVDAGLSRDWEIRSGPD